MHMADALISPAVGGVMWTAAASLIARSSLKIKDDADDGKIPLMGVLGAFIFAAQMINFTIPGTGSSGHLGGGLILAVLLGPYAAFLTLSSVLTIQALFFADGGLLSLGCNIFNLGFFPCFIAYPFIYKKMAGSSLSRSMITSAALTAGIVGLLMGATAVVLETVCSGISELPFRSFLFMMLPVHLAIGIVEGIATAVIVNFMIKARPELIISKEQPSNGKPVSMKKILVGFLALSVFTGGILSWFASTRPDGLEWSMKKVTGSSELAGKENETHQFFSFIQGKTAVLPDYGFKSSLKKDKEKNEEKSSVDAGTSVSGIVGGGLTLVFTLLIGLLLKRRNADC